MLFAPAAGFSHEARPDHRLDVSYAISGSISPSVTFRLAAGQGLVCDAASVLLQEEAIELRPWPGTGDRLLLAVNGGGATARLTLTAGMPGHIGAFELKRVSGRMLAIRDALLAAGPGVAVAFHGRLDRGDAEHDRPPTTLYRVEGSGWAFLRTRGDAIEEKIGAGETLRIRMSALVGMSAAVDFDRIQDRPDWLLLRGPGRVWLQSAPLAAASGEVHAPPAASLATAAPAAPAQPDYRRTAALRSLPFEVRPGA